MEKKRIDASTLRDLHPTLYPEQPSTPNAHVARFLSCRPPTLRSSRRATNLRLQKKANTNKVPMLIAWENFMIQQFS